MGMNPRLKRAKQPAIGNAEAAGIILTDPCRYGGERSALVAWARLFIARHPRPSRLPLFDAVLDMPETFHVGRDLEASGTRPEKPQTPGEGILA